MTTPNRSTVSWYRRERSPGYWGTWRDLPNQPTTAALQPNAEATYARTGEQMQTETLKLVAPNDFLGAMPSVRDRNPRAKIQRGDQIQINSGPRYTVTNVEFVGPQWEITAARPWY